MVRHLEVHFAADQTEDLLFHHPLHINTFDLLQPVSFVADVEALNFLINAVQFVKAIVGGRQSSQAVALKVEAQAAKVDVVAMAVWTLVRALSCVQPFVQFKVDKLCELSWTELALIRLFTRVQS